MVSVFINNDVKWREPSPLWPTLGGAVERELGENASAPAILRFANDEFMEELLRALAYFPDQLCQWIAQKETWRLPMPTPTASTSLDVTKPISKLSQRNERLKQKRAQLLGVAQPIDASKETDDCTSSADAERERLEFKLYQAGQQRFYLVSASLVCARPGRPDRKVDPGKQERTSFVVRRKIRPEDGPDDPISWPEYAYVLTPNGPAWRQVTQNKVPKGYRVMPGEERLPLFELSFTDRQGGPRRIHAGLIPVGRREEYLGAPIYEDVVDEGALGEGAETQAITRENQILKDLFESDVAARWRIVVEQAAQDKSSLADRPANIELGDETFSAPDDSDKTDILKRSREQIQTASWYILLDFAKFLEQYLPDVWDLMTGATPQATGENLDRATTLAETLSGISIKLGELQGIGDSIFNGAAFETTLADALVEIRGGKPYDGENADGIETLLDRIEEPYDRESPHIDWPSLLFPLTDPHADPNMPVDLLFPFTGLDLDPSLDIKEEDYRDYDEEDQPSEVDKNIDIEKAAALARIDTLTELVARALPDKPQAQVPEPLVLAQPIKNPGEARFVIRCVYERPNCEPFTAEAVSEPTRYFEMASFFDPDAPGRPVRIPMLPDFSPAGLRKFRKNAGFVLSDMLCAQLKRTRKLTLGRSRLIGIAVAVS